MKRTFTIGVIAEEIGDAYGSQVISGIEKYLTAKKYFFLTVVHRHDPKLLEAYSQVLAERGVEGLITVDTSILAEPSLPTVAVAGHRQIAGVTNIVLDHKRAARLALEHLKGLGHEEIAFIAGAGFQFGLGSRMECDHRRGEGVGDSDSARADGSDREHSFHAGGGISGDQGIAGAKREIHGSVCLQRYFSDRGDVGAARSRIASARGRLGRGIRRHSGSGFCQSGVDDCEAAAGADGRDCGTDACEPN